MIPYIITSILLSLIGWLVYRTMVRRNATPVMKKVFIYMVVGSSLLLPLAVQPIAVHHPQHVPAFGTPMGFGQFDQHEANLQHFCQCAAPNYSHRIRYQTNAYYNFLLQHKAWITGFILLALGLVLLKVLVQYGYLFFLLKNSRKKFFHFGGKQYTLLHTRKPHAIGAFQLRSPYIIWQQEMDALAPAEINAIIQHELSHLRQYNTIEKAVLNMIQCIWFINPGFYFFRKELDLISECIADEKGFRALGSKKSYAHLLVRLKELQTIPVISHFKGSNLKTRIQHLLAEPRHGHWFWSLASLTLVIAIQMSIVSQVSAQVDETIQSLGTYEEIYLEHPNDDHLLYCPDCSSVCIPVVEFNPCY